MAYNFTITGTEKGLNIRCEGEIGVEHILGLQGFLYADPLYKKTGRVLFDFLNVSYIEGGKEVMQLAMKSIKERPFDTKGKVAFVADDFRILTMLETFRMITEDMPYEIQIFDTVIAGREWVEV